MAHQKAMLVPRAAAPAAARPGVRDLARATGLSVATISRVINGAQQVAVATRQKVLDAVAAQGYEPNAAARALSTRRSRTIGAVIPTLAHSIFATFLDGIERELAQHGYALVIATTGGSAEREAARARELVHLGAEGLIVSGAVRHPQFEALIAAHRLPVVATSLYDPRCRLPTIGYDNRALGRLALQHLLGLGHRRIGVLHGPLADNDRTRLRVAGVKAAGADARLQFFETSLHAAGGAAAARQALAARPVCTALLCLSDVLALGALFEARRLGLAVPLELSVMGFDDLDWAAVCEPPLTTLVLPTADMGERAARALVEHLDRGLPIRAQRLPAALIERGSTAPVQTALSNGDQDVSAA